MIDTAGSEKPDRSGGRFGGGRAFAVILAGQGLSTIGSGMTRFGLGIWVFATTQDAAAFSTLLFFAVLPLGVASLLAGPLIDRLNRKRVMIVANIVASASTLAVALLYFADGLALWHLYVLLSVNGVANAFILPALESSTPLMVSKEQLGRAAGVTQMIQGLEAIVAPAMAGVLVGTVGLGAIFIADFVTFGASILALLASVVPQPSDEKERTGFWQEFMFGVRYVRDRPAFLYLMAFVSWVMFVLPGIGYALVTPLVLTFSTEEAAGLVVAGFGVGSIFGGIALAAWGGPKRRMHGMLVAMAISGVATTVVGLRENAWLMAAAFVVVGASFIFMVGLNRVVWQTKAAPEVLGRIFALRVALGVGAQSLGILIAGTLAESVFEPMLVEGGSLADSVGAWIGVGDGRGMAFMYVLIGLILIITTLVSAAFPALRLFEDRIPDHVPDDAGQLA
ncbi:MAG: MFS transporter [Myxococcota bacterium]